MFRPRPSGRFLYGKTSSSDVFKTVKLGATHAWLTNPTDVGRMARDLNALVKISQTINSIRDSSELQRQVAGVSFSKSFPLRPGRFFSSTSRKTTLRPSLPSTATMAHRRPSRSRAKSCSALCGSSRPSSPPRFPDQLHLATPSACPCLACSAPWACSTSALRAKEQKFGDDHIHFLNSAASIAAVTLENLLALESLKAENRRLRAELDPLEGMVGDGKAMRQLAAMINKVALGDSTVLIRGESGTGKEVVSRAIHAASPRADKPFVAINCAAIPDTLLESELFGHEKGSFTGAVAMKKGKLEVAEDGTVSARRNRRTRAHHAGQAAARTATARIRARRRHAARSSCMLAFWPPPIKTSRPPSRAANFARTSTSA